MRCSVIQLATVFTLFVAAFSGVATAQQPRAGSPGLRAGYDFDPGAVPGPITNGYSIDPATETIDAGSLDDFRISRRFELFRDPGPMEQRIAVEIGVSMDEVDPLGSVQRFIDEVFMAIDAGDQDFVSAPVLGPGGRINLAGDTVLFTQSNIFVRLEQLSGPPVPMMSMAQEIFSDIKGRPSVAALPLPMVSAQTHPAPGVTELVEGQIQAFTVSEFDPMGAPLTRVYLAPDGEVDESGSEPTYEAGSTVGVQRLTVVVVTPSLLAARAFLDFNVAAP